MRTCESFGKANRIDEDVTFYFVFEVTNPKARVMEVIRHRKKIRLILILKQVIKVLSYTEMVVVCKGHDSAVLLALDWLHVMQKALIQY